MHLNLHKCKYVFMHDSFLQKKSVCFLKARLSLLDVSKLVGCLTGKEIESFYLKSIISPNFLEHIYLGTERDLSHVLITKHTSCYPSYPLEKGRITKFLQQCVELHLLKSQ